MGAPENNSFAEGNPGGPGAPPGNDRARNNDGGAPPGNDRARGNNGGAPENNQHATKHGLHADPDNLLAHLRENDKEGFAWIHGKYESYLDAAPFERHTALAEQLLQVCVREYSIWKASGIQLREGLVQEKVRTDDRGEVIEYEGEPLTTQVETAANLPVDRMESTVVRRLKELGVMPGSSTDGFVGGQSVHLVSDDYEIIVEEDEDLEADDTEYEIVMESDGDEAATAVDDTDEKT
jgi:hypothetical protein